MVPGELDRVLGVFGGLDVASDRHEEREMRALVDPAKVADAHGDGVSFDEIRRRVWETYEFRPEGMPDMAGSEPQPGDPPLPVKW